MGFSLILRHCECTLEVCMSVCHILLLSNTPLWMAFSLLLFTSMLIRYDCKAKESILNLWQVEKIGFFLQSVQTSLGAHLALYPLDTWGKVAGSYS